MGKDLRSALLDAGLVTKAAVDRVEQKKAKVEEKARANTEESNRARDLAKSWGGWFGDVKPRFYYWMLAGRVPRDVSELCCVCDKVGKTPAEAAREVEAILETGGVTAWEILGAGDPVAGAILREITDSVNVDVLYPFSDQLYPDLQKVLEAHGRLRICGACQTKIVREFAGETTNRNPMTEGGR